MDVPDSQTQSISGFRRRKETAFRSLRPGNLPPRLVQAEQEIQVAGYYKISPEREAVRRLSHPYDPKMIPTDLSSPMQLALFVSRGAEGMGSRLR